MARILITSGPTRQYLDPVRYLSNASSGRMGSCLAQSALNLGHEVVIVSGPVEIEYPTRAKLIPVETTEEMLNATLKLFPECDGVIGAAAPCDYQPAEFSQQKIRKTGEFLEIKLVETQDILGTLGRAKRTNQWIVGFALETENAQDRAFKKLQRKKCDLVVINGATAINSPDNSIEIIDTKGGIIASMTGPKPAIADLILAEIQQLMDGNR